MKNTISSNKNEYFSAKELTILPGRSALIKDKGPYGAIVVQGHGSFGSLSIESPAMIRFGQMTQDELFVTDNTAKKVCSSRTQAAPMRL